MNDTESPAPRGPLDGIVVADFSRVLAGPSCAMLVPVLGEHSDEIRDWPVAPSDR